MSKRMISQSKLGLGVHLRAICLGAIGCLLGLSPSIANAQVCACTCLGAPATICGTAGNDLINGTAGNDVICGLGGDDQIYGGGGNDVICGNAGADFLDGEAGNDLFEGGPGNDTLADQGGGIDTAYYVNSPAAVQIFLDNSNPSPDGYGFVDSFDNVENAYGSAYDDYLGGNSSNNRLEGNGGDDDMRGLQGQDVLNGGLGFDRANGGAGNDVCTAELMSSC